MMTRASFFDAGNRLYLMLCDVMDYNDVISATDSLKFVKDVRFTDVYIVEYIVVQYVEAGNFWDDPRIPTPCRKVCFVYRYMDGRPHFTPIYCCYLPGNQACTKLRGSGVFSSYRDQHRTYSIIQP